ncbi:hypothetical protein QCA50_017356 [Cerrena zonata]|uniref:Uncharacterized protein n=1 Tax=Cerrena zonata TaxID=2478898 RepID=A0AAW0FN05_9APHY
MSGPVQSLRASPAVGLGGMYATGAGEDNPVTIAARRPPFIEHQRWILEPVNTGLGSENTVQVLLAGDPSLAWTVQRGVDSEADGAKVLLLPRGGPEVTTWVKRPVSGAENTFTLSVLNELIGATWYAGSNKETNEVVIKVIPVIANPEEPPYWVGQPANED